MEQLQQVAARPVSLCKGRRGLKQKKTCTHDDVFQRNPVVELSTVVFGGCFSGGCVRGYSETIDYGGSGGAFLAEDARAGV